VLTLFMALLSFRGISTPSLPAQGGQRRFSYFNIQRGNPHQHRGDHAALKARAGHHNLPSVTNLSALLPSSKTIAREEDGPDLLGDGAWGEVGTTVPADG
jgi:hypothetical protein